MDIRITTTEIGGQTLNNDSLVSVQRSLVWHAAALIALGFIGGIIYTFGIITDLRWWPVAGVSVPAPGSTSAWRGGHVGPLMNALLGFALAWALSLLELTAIQMRRYRLAVISILWGNGAFYLFSPLSRYRGLSLYSAEFGPGNVADYLAFLPALVAMVGGFVVLVLVFKGLRAAHS